MASEGKSQKWSGKQKVQVWLSTQTGGHLGFGLDVAVTKSGLYDALEARWGANSPKFKGLKARFKAVSENGLDVFINMFNTIVNFAALDEEFSTSNILALTSSTLALAGDTTMMVRTILVSSAQGVSKAGPIGAAVGAILYIASYATGVASGMVSAENLEPKDYVIIFLSPIIPDPSFGAMVNMIDQYNKGNIEAAFYIYMTESLPAMFYQTGMILKDLITGSSSFSEYRSKLQIFLYILGFRKREEAKNKVKEQLQDYIEQTKPYAFWYPEPAFDDNKKYYKTGWSGQRLKDAFGISEQTDRHIFAAKYKEGMTYPKSCEDTYPQTYITFCAAVVNHSDDPFMFVGSNKLDDIAVLDDKTTALGQEGDDHFFVDGSVENGIAIFSGPGEDTIHLNYTQPSSQNYIDAGDEEVDKIYLGPGDDTVVVNNDVVTDTGGDNTFRIEGDEHDDIKLGDQADLLLIKKESGYVTFDRFTDGDQNLKPKRFVYCGQRTWFVQGRFDGTDVIQGSKTNYDTLSMKSYEPWTSTTLAKGRIAIYGTEKSLEGYLNGLGRRNKQVLFEGHRNEIQLSNGDQFHMKNDAQQIQMNSIERLD